MYSYTQSTILVFGISCLVAGIASLASSFSDTGSLAEAQRANSLAAIAMGLYYPLAASQNNTTFFILTVPMRLLTTLVFLRQGWTVPGVWEGTGACLTALALFIDGRRGDVKRKE